MLKLARNYLTDLTKSTGAGWNQFWFAPQAYWHLSLLRQLVGLAAFLWLLSFSFDLTGMLGDRGWLTVEAVQQAMTGGDPTATVPGFSHLFYVRSAALLWATHLAAMACTLLVAFGIAPRLTTPLAFVVILSYVHRTAIVSNQFETILCMLLLYLSLAPARNFTTLLRTKATDDMHWLANLSTRLIQVHLCGIYVMIATSKFAAPGWSTGDGLWYMLSDSQHRLVDLTSVISSNYALNALSHAWLYFELAFPVLVWNRTLRPLMLAISTFIWVATALVSGLVGYCFLMLVANIAFVSSDQIKRLARSANPPR